MGDASDVGTLDWEQLQAIGSMNPADAVAGMQQPVRVRASPATAWPAYGHWSPAYLAERLSGRKALRDVIASPTPQIVYYDKDKPLKELRGMTYRMPLHERRNVTVATFFDTIANASDPTYLYWVGQKQRSNLFKWIENDLQPLAPFRVGSGRSGQPGVQTWVGKAGLTSVVHYDASHNFYVQLYGEKTFVIFPPDAAPHFQICPFLHPGDGHSCLDWAALEAGPDATADTTATSDQPGPGKKRAAVTDDWKQLQPRVVPLKAGDVLYLPPYWLHHVVTTGAGPAISVSMISESDEQHLMTQVEAYPLPFDHSWRRRVRIGATVQLFQQLLTALDLRTSAGPRELLEARYRAWYGSRAAAQANKALTEDFTCSPTKAASAAVPKAAQDLAAIFRSVQNPGVRVLLLFNYLEGMAHWAVQDAALVPVLLQLMARQCP